MATDWTSQTSAVAAYLMDDASGGAADATGNGYDLTELGGNPGAYQATGKYGTAIDFQEINNRGLQELTTAGSLDNMVTVSVMAWIQPDTAGESDLGCIVSKYHNTVDGWKISLSTTALEYQHQFSGGVGRWRWYGAFTYPETEFIHVAAIYDASSSSNDAYFYKDGVGQAGNESNTPGGSRDDDSAADLAVGINSTVSEFDGRIDEILIFEGLMDSTDVNEAMDNGIDGSQGGASIGFFIGVTG
jgi:hypothetical protein